MERIAVNFDGMLDADGVRVALPTDFCTVPFGVPVMLYEPNAFEVEAVVEVEARDDGRVQVWGVIDWDTISYLADDEEDAEA